MYSSTINQNPIKQFWCNISSYICKHNLIGSYMYLCFRYWRTKVQLTLLTFVFVSVMYYKADRLHVAMHLLSNRSQRMSKCGKYISSFCIFFNRFWCDLWSTQDRKNPGLIARGNWVDLLLSKLKIEVQWPGGRVKLASVVLWVWIKM